MLINAHHHLHCLQTLLVMISTHISHQKLLPTCPTLLLLNQQVERPPFWQMKMSHHLSWWSLRMHATISSRRSPFPLKNRLHSFYLVSGICASGIGLLQIVLPLLLFLSLLSCHNFAATIFIPTGKITSVTKFWTLASTQTKNLSGLGPSMLSNSTVSSIILHQFLMTPCYIINWMPILMMASKNALNTVMWRRRKHWKPGLMLCDAWMRHILAKRGTTRNSLRRRSTSTRWNMLLRTMTPSITHHVTTIPPLPPHHQLPHPLLLFPYQHFLMLNVLCSTNTMAVQNAASFM